MNNDYRDKIRGSLIGGAAGDALGYAVEFDYIASIFNKYGDEGITEYELNASTGKAVVSDDTQMVLFTANGILVKETSLRMNGKADSLHNYIGKAYLDWLFTQESCYTENRSNYILDGRCGNSWLLDVPELYARRAPGNTCLSALYDIRNTSLRDDYLEKPCNGSKGCGGVMRVAPIGLYSETVSISEVAMDAAVASAITHGHPLGYLPSAVLAYIINRIVYAKNNIKLKDVVGEARDAVCEMFKETKCIDELKRIIDKAIECAENDDSDINNIGTIGEGWVGEEALAISIYCALRYEHDFSGGIIAAVNHNGDSDSTGAITGNILGAINGYDAIEQKWKRNLEIADVILEIADDLYYVSTMPKEICNFDVNWKCKYAI